MCGLYAGIGKLNSNRMVALGSMNEDRGTDSVGIAYLAKDGVRVAKVAERPCVALNTTLRKDVTEAAIAGMFIGHTRQATQGSVCNENAHPFLMDGIAFAHNGIIINDNEFGEYAVDSMALIHGIKAKDFSKYEGCIALVWIQEGKLNAFRCGNPLYRGRHKGVTYLASEDKQLKAIGCTNIRELKEGFIYTFHDAMKITTEKVKKNKTFSYANSPVAVDWEAYTFGSKGGYVSKHNDSRHQVWTNASDYSQELEQEKFETWKDAKIKASETTDYCDMCSYLGELVEGICLDCIMWTKSAQDKDIPPMISGR